MKRYIAFIIVAMTGGWCSWSPAAEPTELFIEQALDNPATINFSNITLDDALKGISNAMGVRLDADESALSQLPYGRLTPLASVQLQNITWRQALREFLAPLALRFQVGKEQIYILGTDELLRQPRRLTANELAALVALQQSNVNNSDERLLRQIREVTRMDFGLIINGIRQEKTDKDIDEDILHEKPISAAEALTTYCRVLASKGNRPAADLTWFVQTETSGNKEGLNIVMLSQSELAGQKLDRCVDVSFRNVPVQSILIDLGRSAVIPVSFEPGCIALVDSQIRENASLTLQNGSIRMALEALAGMTGLQYRTEGLKLHITAGENLKAIANRSVTAVTTTSSNPTVAVLTLNIPGSDIPNMIFIRQDDLKEQGLLEKYQKMRKAMLEDFYKVLRELPDEPMENKP